MAFVPLEKLHQLHDGYRRCFRVERLSLILLQDQGQIHLIENRCPHMDAALERGSVSNGSIRCPMHGISFRLRDGAAVNTPAHLPPLKTFVPAYEGNTIGIVI